jgi:hypothetical protein
VLVGAGLLGGTGRRRYVLAGLGVGAALVALGQHAPAFEAVTTLLPPLRLLRYPVKAMILVGFAWAGLAALGVEAWRAAGASSRRVRWALLPVAVLGAATALAVVTLVLSPETFRPFLALGEAAVPTARVLRPLALSLTLRASLATLVLLLVWTARRGRVRPAVLAAALAAVAVVDLALAHPRPNPVAPLALYTHRPEVLTAIGDPATARVYSYDYSETAVSSHRLGRRYAHQVARAPAGWTGEASIALGMQMSLVPQTAGRWGVRQGFDIDYRGLQPESLSRLTHLARLVEDRPGALVRLLRIGAVTQVVGLHRVGGDDLAAVAVVPGLFPDPIRVLAVPDPLPRAFVVGGARVAAGLDGLEALLDPGFDPREEVILPSGSPRPAPSGFAGSARVLEERADRVRIEVDLSAKGYVVLVDTFDPGWRTSVDDQPAELLRANVAFRAVAVPAGQHVVEMVYRPPLTGAGLVLGGLALLLILVLLVRRPAV